MIAQGTPAEPMRSDTLEKLIYRPGWYPSASGGAAPVSFVYNVIYILYRRRLLTAMALAAAVWGK